MKHFTKVLICNNLYVLTAINCYDYNTNQTASILLKRLFKIIPWLTLEAVSNAGQYSFCHYQQIRCIVTNPSVHVQYLILFFVFFNV